MRVQRPPRFSIWMDFRLSDVEVNRWLRLMFARLKCNDRLRMHFAREVANNDRDNVQKYTRLTLGRWRAKIRARVVSH